MSLKIGGVDEPSSMRDARTRRFSSQENEHLMIFNFLMDCVI